MTQTECGPVVTRIADGAELPAPGRWQIDPGHTELAFIGRHFMLTKVRGRFIGLSGVIEVGEAAGDSTVAVAGQPTGNARPARLRRGAVTVAAGRVALGLTALAWPAVPARPWVGASADDLAARVFGRALGARDLALGLGALAALQRPGAEPGSAAAWVAAGALSDALDVAASVASWRDLPRVTKWLVAASAGGAALTGAAAALTSATSRASSGSASQRL